MNKKLTNRIALYKHNSNPNDRLLKIIYYLQKNLGKDEAKKVIDLIGYDTLNYISLHW